MTSAHRHRTYIALAVATVCVLGFGADTAYAYIDPGTGSSLLSSLGMILAVATTGIALGLTQVRRCGHWLVARLTCRRASKQNPQNESPDS